MFGIALREIINMKKWIGKFYSDIIGIGFLLAAIVTTLSLLSYNPKDPSLNHLTFMKASNLCGLVGSFWSDILYQLFGLASWLWVPIFIRQGIEGIKGQISSLNLTRWAPTVLTVLILAGLFKLHGGSQTYFGGTIEIGGLGGKVVVLGATQVLNPVGAGIVLWMTALMLLIFNLNKTVRELATGLLNVGDQLKASLFAIRNRDSVQPHSSGVEVNFEQTQSVEIPETSSKEVKFHEKVKAALKIRPKNQIQMELPENRDFEEVGSASPQKEKAESSKAAKRRVVLRSKVPVQIENWTMPKLGLLEDPPASRPKVDKEELKRKAEQLTEKLRLFNITGTVVAAKSGPAVTMLEFKPNAEVKLSNITSMENDLAIALSSESLRIIAPIPGRDVVGIETSNTTRETVYLKDLLAEENFWNDDIKLPIALGRQTNGDPQIVDLRKLPHLLVAGSTGSGKSVFTVSTITGLLFRHSPKSLKMILIDPKQVDLAAFSQIPHLLLPPIVETPKAVAALRWAVKEMDKRYRSMSKFGARGLEAYNEAIQKLTEEDREKHRQFNEDLDEKNKKNQKYYFHELPYLVIVVEEFGDLMQIDSDNVEQSVVRLAQLARACGIHLILCMQSPRKEIVTGLIKTNIPGRISFKVASKMDSRIILDEAGAERLLARGDMLFRAPGTDKPIRHHGPWLSDIEINGVAKFWSDQSEPQYDAVLLNLLEEGSERGSGVLEDSDEQEGSYDEMYDEIVEFVSTVKEVSASLLQRRFKLGYPRAARLIEVLEREGVVGPANGSKPRQVLVKSYSA